MKTPSMNLGTSPLILRLSNAEARATNREPPRGRGLTLTESPTLTPYKVEARGAEPSPGLGGVFRDPQNERRFATAALALILLSPPALAGGRAHYGGTLAVTAVTKSADLDPLLADTPVDAALMGLTATPICRLAEFSRPTPSTLRLTTAYAAEITNVLNRVRTDASVYRALLAPLKNITATPTGLDLTLDGTNPSLEKALCHPALSVPVAPYVKGLANAHHPAGRPYPDSVTVQRTDARTADRLLGQRRTHIVLGTSAPTDSPQLFATYVVLPSGNAPPALRQAIEATTERADLTRFFVRSPAAPLFGLLPPSLGGSTVAPVRPAKPAAQTAPQEVTLAFDTSSDDHRAIAEKLQVRLQPLGFRVSFRPVSHAELRARWASGSSELMLHTVLLPPAPGAALALVYELARQRVPASITSAPDLVSQDKAARDLAFTAAPSLDVIPLCVQGLGVSTSNDVQHLTRDAMGLPRLDDVFLSSE